MSASMFDALNDISNLTPTSAPLTDITPDPEQDRKEFDQEELENLAASIREVGVLQPVVVSPTGGNPPWKLVAGERRWRAAQMAGLTEIPMVVREDFAETKESDSRSDIRHLAQMIENANRSDLRDYEMAKGIRRQLDKWGDKRGDRGRIAKLINRPAASISRLLALLDPEVEPLVKEGVIRNAEAVSRFRALDADMQTKLLEEARASGEPITQMTIRDAQAARDLASQPAPAVASTSTDTVSAGTSAAEEDATTSQADGADSPAAGHGITVANDSDRAGDVSPENDGGESMEHAEHHDGRHHDEHDEEHDDEQDNSDARGGFDSNAGSTSAGASSSAGGAREKAVAIQLTGERIEVLLRYVVDKSTDRLELRLPADLGRAVIENLGGEVPERPETYAELIRDLLDAKM